MVPTYHRPTDVTEAVQLKATLGEGAVYLAGGTEVNNLHGPRPAALIDLAGLGLGRIETTPEGLRLGAGVTFQQLIEHPDVPDFLRAAARQMTNRNIRNRATVGGHLATNRSCADLIPALLAASATVARVDGDWPLEQLLDSPPDLILAVFVPVTTRGFGLGHQTRTAADVSIVTAAASLTLEGEALRLPILAVGGVAPHVVRLHEVEQALDGRPLPVLEELERRIAAAVHPLDDLRGSAAYKRQIAAVLGARALQTAVHRFLSAEGAR
ncbi:MAG: FAD binding domain-containing protein [Myxococcota bacterium]|jgi:probable selenate reductase FAD-binding subunit|nr:FAD binding domain-containing protein [Myxococcota bacterium]